MVDNKKTVGYSVLAAMVGALIMLGTVSLLDDNAYYCKATNTAMNCDSLAKYYGLDNGKCMNTKVGNKLCTSGWLKVTNDVIVSPEFSSSTDAKQYLCSTTGCEVKV